MRRFCIESLRPYLGRSVPRAVRLDDGLTRMGSTGLPTHSVLPVVTVMDRVIQQAIAQVRTPIFDPGLSESSFGF